MRRFSIRTLMGIVAIIGLFMATTVMVKRSNEFRARARDLAYYAGMMDLDAYESREQMGDLPRAAHSEQVAACYRELKLKYERAARYPWLPVDPDPPPTAVEKGAQR
jgi:hypothetical protein